MTLDDMKLLHILVVLLCYISDRVFNSSLCANCFDELFSVWFQCLVYNWYIEYLTLYESTTALTSSSFLHEHLLLRIRITVILITTWQTPTIHKKKTSGLNEQNQHSVGYYTKLQRCELAQELESRPELTRPRTWPSRPRLRPRNWLARQDKDFLGVHQYEVNSNK